MSKAQQAAEERYPRWVHDDLHHAGYWGFLAGFKNALPEVPDDAVIEVMARAIYGQIAFRGGDEEHYESVRGGIYDAAARAAYAALRGAMQ